MLSLVADPARSCGTSADWLARVLADLEWFGHVVVFLVQEGAPALVRLTEKGSRGAGG